MPADMFPSVTASTARPEAFAEAFEVALAFAFDEGIGSKVTATQLRLQWPLAEGLQVLQAKEPQGGAILHEVSVQTSLQPSSQVDRSQSSSQL